MGPCIGVTESLDGKLWCRMMGRLSDRDVGVVGIGIYPNLLAEACSDHAVTLRFTPISPELTEVDGGPQSQNRRLTVARRRDLAVPEDL